jgi:DMSO/TMAO reductase YedYZ molybdopterin-dependent catalytic subunit
MAKLLWELWKQRRQAGKPADPALAARVPPGQSLTAKWPVLTYGRTPPFDPARWTFTVKSDVHCVTRWSRLDNTWEGVPVQVIIEACRPRPTARFVLQHADPNYTTNTAIEDLVDDDVVLALKHDGRALAPEHGGPMRLILPKLYFWKSSKWLRAFEFLDVNPPGFWEQNGYHMRGDPWTEERYSDGETRAMQHMRADASRNG